MLPKTNHTQAKELGLHRKGRNKQYKRKHFHQSYMYFAKRASIHFIFHSPQEGKREREEIF